MVQSERGRALFPSKLQRQACPYFHPRTFVPSYFRANQLFFDSTNKSNGTHVKVTVGFGRCSFSIPPPLPPSRFRCKLSITSACPLLSAQIDLNWLGQARCRYRIVHWFYPSASLCLDGRYAVDENMGLLPLTLCGSCRDFQQVQLGAFLPELGHTLFNWTT